MNETPDSILHEALIRVEKEFGLVVVEVTADWLTVSTMKKHEMMLNTIRLEAITRR